MTTTTTRRVQLGSVSTGTLRLEDLIPALIGELEYYRAAPKLVKRIVGIIAANDFAAAYWASEDAEFDLDDLYNALSELAPPLTYFGAHYGDGADIGFWPDHDAIDSERRYATSRDGDYEFLPDTEVWIHVNDHGNITVLTDDDNGNPGAEIWSAQ